MSGDFLKSDKIVSIGKARARVLFPSLGRVEAYWEGLRDGRMMPTRAEVDPRGISDVLEHAFVLEKVAPGVARIRLAGMHLNELMAMEVRGMPLTAMFLPEARRELQKVIEEVLETPSVVRLTLGSDKGLSRPALDGQMMLLPLRDAHGNATRILGVLETRGRIGRGPRRFMIRDIETKAITGRAEVGPEVAGFARRAEPRLEPKPALKPIPAERLSGFDAFAPRTQELAREIAARQARRGEERQGEARREAVPAPELGARLKHLRLVHDADEL